MRSGKRVLLAALPSPAGRVIPRASPPALAAPAASLQRQERPDLRPCNLSAFPFNSTPNLTSTLEIMASVPGAAAPADGGQSKRPARGILSRGSSFLGSSSDDGGGAIGDGMVLLGTSRLTCLRQACVGALANSSLSTCQTSSRPSLTRGSTSSNAGCGRTLTGSRARPARSSPRTSRPSLCSSPDCCDQHSE